ncbi:MAG: dephospho-CoA kinase [Candidatus Micrarchaeota archaeon]|nr:dephospho-CoA kinase [Candidatus Micrarchaeota archaeon]
MIIGLTGTFGAGKGEVAKYLKGKGFAYHSCSDVLREELKRRGVEENVDNLAELGNRIRMTHGDGELARRLLKTIRERGEKNSVVDSLRTPGEIEELRKAGDFHLIALDALPEIRYARIKLRNRPGDNVSYEKFLEQERSQLSGQLGSWGKRQMIF